MNRALALLTLLPLAACELFDGIKDGVDGATEAMVVQGTLLGVEAPETEDLDLSDSPLAGARATFFLADATSVDDLESAPVTNADASLEGESIGAVTVRHVGSGAYTVAPTEGLDYVDAEDWDFVVDRGGETSLATIRLPNAPTLDAPSAWTPSTAMDVGVSGGNYDSLLALVVSLPSGEVTWSNEPEDIRGVYELTHDGGDTTGLTVPAEAFPTAGVYALGVAGMRNTEAADLDGFNILLSNVMSGKMRVVRVDVAN